MTAAGVRDNLRVAPHYVYRCYAINGALLYVGCTTNLKTRLREHKGSDSKTPAPWYGVTARVTTEHFPDAATARHAEDEAIRTEFPVFNVIGTGKHSPRATGFSIEPHSPCYKPRHAAVAAA
jgi:predicted GIY-YIG superfamily endonuclease